ncbi:Tripartite motif-containing protein 16 [Nibea albiflora]|uniref:Tripartite motif-containing protein 16 n=1 Tax=Nibea albiflora TaxID=240163 RepID=A0ACB7F017_NIBAL|nr:Tripartite motif-containing protein 16 [Nibea albiflora]
MEDMKKRSAELDHLAQTDSDVYFLQKWPSLRRLCEKDLHPHREVSEDPLVAFKFTKKAVDEFGSRLEEFCDKEFASISQTGGVRRRDRGGGGEGGGGEEEEEEDDDDDDDMQERCEASTSARHGLCGANNALTEQAVEPKTRADFLQYACVLSLDPDTAHKDLAISAGDKKVSLGPPKYKNSPVHSAKRFIHRRQVLCREALQAERCYYEVEVEGDKVEIALAYEGIDRKSRTEQSAFGGNANSWSLDRSKSYSVSHRGEGIKLTKSPSHHRIGVYLEFKKGALWFYEVSDSMEFLYKLEAEFTEPLYPGFWLGERCCIRICDLR